MDLATLIGLIGLIGVRGLMVVTIMMGGAAYMFVNVSTLLGIQAGQNPRLIDRMLRAYPPVSQRAAQAQSNGNCAGH